MGFRFKAKRIFQQRFLKPLLRKLILEVVNTEAFVFGDPARLRLGINVKTVNTLFNTVSGTITLGDNCFMGHDCKIITGSHAVDSYGIDRQNNYAVDGRDVILGRGVWVGSGAILLGPVTVGDDAVIAAGAVILPGTVIGPKTIWGGVPARKLKDIEITKSNLQ